MALQLGNWDINANGTLGQLNITRSIMTVIWWAKCLVTQSKDSGMRVHKKSPSRGEQIRIQCKFTQDFFTTTPPA